jgi:FtsZ-interacting cell division protein ZipA
VTSQDPAKKKVRTLNDNSESVLAEQVAELSLHVRALTESFVPSRTSDRGRSRSRGASQDRRDKSNSVPRRPVRTVEAPQTDKKFKGPSQPNRPSPRNVEVNTEVENLRRKVIELEKENAVLSSRSMSSGPTQRSRSEQTDVKQVASNGNGHKRPPPSGSCYNCGSTEHWRNDCPALYPNGRTDNGTNQRTYNNQGNGRGRGPPAGHANGQ